jgi:hypothetical protein
VDSGISENGFGKDSLGCEPFILEYVIEEDFFAIERRESFADILAEAPIDCENVYHESE